MLFWVENVFFLKELRLFSQLFFVAALFFLEGPKIVQILVQILVQISNHSRTAKSTVLSRFTT